MSEARKVQDAERVARDLQQEAVGLLKTLRKVLEQYGRVEPSGSFALDLMVWRDLDIRLVRDDLDRSAFFALGAELRDLLDPSRMSYRDELQARTPGLPRGLYWGVYLGDERAGAWKIDVWATTEDDYESSRKDLEDLARQIDPQRRLAILRIKGAIWRHPEYRRSVTARHVYEAVLHAGVSDQNGFIRWLEDRGITANWG